MTSPSRAPGFWLGPYCIFFFFCVVLGFHNLFLLLLFCFSSFCVLFGVSLDYPFRGHRGRDRMVVGFTTTYVINAYYH